MLKLNSFDFIIHITKVLTEHLSKLDQEIFLKHLETTKQFCELMRRGLPEEVIEVINRATNTSLVISNEVTETVPQIITQDVSQPKSNHLSNVYKEHETLLNGWNLILPIIGNGACFDNSAAAHIYEDPIQGLNLKRMRHSFIVQNWSYFGNFFPIPFIERVGTGNGSYMICCETYEDLAKFLLSEESLFLFSNSSIDIVALATMFHIDKHTFIYNRLSTTGDALPER